MHMIKHGKKQKTVQLAYNLNTKLFSKVCNAHSGELNNNLSLAKLNKENVMIEVIKKQKIQII